MDSDRWKQVDNLLQSVLERPPVDRAEFLRQACGGDEALEREVRSLLSSRAEAGGKSARVTKIGPRAHSAHPLLYLSISAANDLAIHTTMSG